MDGKLRAMRSEPESQRYSPYYFYDQHHPEYPNANSVVDYILEHHDRGGMVAMNGQQHLNKGNGKYGATGQILTKSPSLLFQFQTAIIIILLNVAMKLRLI